MADASKQNFCRAHQLAVAVLFGSWPRWAIRSTHVISKSSRSTKLNPFGSEIHNQPVAIKKRPWSGFFTAQRKNVNDWFTRRFWHLRFFEFLIGFFNSEFRKLQAFFGTLEY